MDSSLLFVCFLVWFIIVRR